MNYERISDDGLHISFGPDRQRPQLLAVDSVVICAGQEPVRDLETDLRSDGVDPHIIGGAALAAELTPNAPSNRAPSLPPACDGYPATPFRLR